LFPERVTSVNFIITAAKNAGPETLEELLVSAEALMDEYDVAGATSLLAKALELDADNPKALTLTANICLEVFTTVF
jgi:uncharacterized protein HemY